MAKSATVSRKSRKSAAAQTVSDTLILNMEVSADAAIASNEDAALAELMAALDVPSEIVIEAAPTAADEIIESSTLDAVLADAESVEASIAAATPEGEAADLGAPEAAEGEVVDAATGEAKTKRVSVPRKHYTNKADRIKDRLGASLVDYTVLTVADAGLDEGAVRAKSDETMEIIRKMNKKEQNRASLFMEFVSGKKDKLNEVLERCLKVLAADGKITTGKDGNLLANLLARPYSPAAARAMGGNTVGMFADLKVIVPDGSERPAVPS